MAGNATEAFFHIVRAPSNLHALSQKLYGDTSSLNAREFRRINSAVADSEGQVIQGQLLFIPESACRADEEAVVETLVNVNEIVLGYMTWEERKQMAEAYQFLDNVAANPSTLKTGISVANTVTNTALGGLSTETKVLGEILKNLENAYKNSYQRHGRLTNEFYAYRQQIHNALETSVGRLARRVALGTPTNQSAKRALKVNTKSQILHWKRNGIDGHVKGFEQHFENMHRVNRFLKTGGYATIALDAALTGDTIIDACQASITDRHCYKTATVESAGLVGRVGGGVVGGYVGYVACNAVFGLPSGGSSLLWCGLVVGGAAGYAGGAYGGAKMKDGAETIFDATYPVTQ